jgi:hypothetical protein
MSAQDIDYETRRRIREFIRQHMAEPLTATQVRGHFRLPADAEPEISEIMTEVALIGRLGSQPESAPPARDLAALACEIRNAWLITTTAIPLPVTPFPGQDDPEMASAVQARDQAFGWALSKLVDGGYAAPQYQVTALATQAAQAAGDRGHAVSLMADPSSKKRVSG